MSFGLCHSILRFVAYEPELISQHRLRHGTLRTQLSYYEKKLFSLSRNCYQSNQEIRDVRCKSHCWEGRNIE
jgi:hypothetical protein